MWLIEELAEKCNDEKTAIIHREQSISFKELWDKSEKLASYIDSKCSTKAPVLIYGNKDINITVVMLASLKTGRAYVPIDITFPRERLLQISSMTHSEIVFNFSNVEISGNFQVVDKSYLDSDIYNSSSYTTISSDNWVKPEDTCYILFTSGSTGLPKGVQITRNNIENFVNWFQKGCEIDEKSQYVLNQVSYSFDVSVIALYIYLPMGKTLFNIDKGMIDDFQLLFKYLKVSDISVWISTPAFLEICSFADDFNSEMLPKLKKFILAGEVLTKKLVHSIHDKFQGFVVINGYGPTEGTVLLSACEITEEMLSDEKSLPIGKVIPESEYYIAGEDGKAVAEGISGELVVISNSISKGYFNNPEQTNKVFFRSEDGRMGYKTGDLVFENNGMLYYIARKDFQIKLNGYRIELDDISNNLNKIDIVSNNIVMPVYKEERVSYIVAFVTLNTHPDMPNVKIGISIKNELKNLIPSYMIPRKIVILDRFPLNTNGKIDRKKLMEGM